MSGRWLKKRGARYPTAGPKKRDSVPEIFRTILGKIARFDLADGSSGLDFAVDIKGVYDLAPMVWLDFLNADPDDGLSMWPVYKRFARSMEDLRDWLASAGGRDMEALEKVKLHSRELFLKIYSIRKDDAKMLHGRMGDIINEDISDLVKDIMQDRLGEDLGKFVMPHLFFNIRIASDGDPFSLRFDIPQATHPNFWLSVMLSSLVFSVSEGTSVHRCAAPDCNQYFVPTLRGRGQLYHSQRCQNRHYMRKRRS